MKKVILFVAIFTFVSAASLWNDTQQSPYSPVIAKKTGDILTIFIDENNSALQKADTRLDKDTSFGGRVNLNWSQVATFIDKDPNAKYDYDTTYRGNNQFKGSGSTGRSSRLKAKMTAVIYDIDDGGYFIRGSKKIIINNEEEEITIEGKIRKEDIAKDNSVLSSLISDAILTIQGSGNIVNDQEKGFLAKMFGWIF